MAASAASANGGGSIVSSFGSVIALSPVISRHRAPDSSRGTLSAGADMHETGRCVFRRRSRSGHTARMDMTWTGYVAATLTTVAFLPQTIKTIRSRDTRSISLWMYLVFTVGVVFWLVYGIVLDSW